MVGVTAIAVEPADVGKGVGELRIGVNVCVGSPVITGTVVVDGPTSFATTSDAPPPGVTATDTSTVRGVKGNATTVGGKELGEGAAATAITGDACPGDDPCAEGSTCVASTALSTASVGRLVRESVEEGRTGTAVAKEVTKDRGSNDPGAAVGVLRRVIVGRFKRFVRGATGAIVAIGTGVSEKLITTGGGEGGPHPSSQAEKTKASARSRKPRRKFQQKEWLAMRHHLTPVDPLHYVFTDSCNGWTSVW